MYILNTLVILSILSISSISTAALSLPQRSGMFPSRDFPIRSKRVRQVYLAEEEIQGRYVPTKTFDPSSIKRKEAGADDLGSLQEDEDDDDLIQQLSDLKRSSTQVKEL